MKNLDFWRHVSIGRYVEGNTIIHRLSPAVKYLWMLALVIPASASPAAAAAALALGLAIVAAIVARVPVGRLLGGALSLMPFIAIAGIFQVLVSWPSDTSVQLLQVGGVSFTVREAVSVGSMVIRFLALMTTLGLFTSVTSESETARGVEDLFAPLSRLGFPGRGLALSMAVAFRFIPIIAGELESIVKAQAARGADFGTGRAGPIRKARAYLPLVVPVIVRALERAESLAVAMEARGYGIGAATRYTVPTDSRANFVAGLLGVMVGLVLMAAGYLL